MKTSDRSIILSAIDLIRDGRRVALTSNAHKAIDNLLAVVAAQAFEQKFVLKAIKKVSGDETPAYPAIEVMSDKNDARLTHPYDLNGEAMSNVIPFIPGLTPATLAEDEVTIARLSSLLAAAVMDHELDEDGDLYISDGLDFPAWIHIDGDRKFLMLSTYCRVEEPGAPWLSHVNDMNSKVKVVQFCYRGDAIWGSCWISFDGGLNVRQLIKMLRAFSGAFCAGLKLHEPRTADAALQPGEGQSAGAGS